MNWPLKARIVDVYGTQSDFAHTLKASDAFISRVVCGRRSLSKEDQKRWAVLLKCKISDIFENEAKKI